MAVLRRRRALRVVVATACSVLLVVASARPIGHGFGSSPVAAADDSLTSYLHALGAAPTYGEPRVDSLVAVVATPTGRGYWLSASDGSVFGYGDAPYFGSMGATRLRAPIVAIAATVTGGGYWLVAADGSVFGFGDATYGGSMGTTRLAAPIVSIVATPTGRGYWLAGGDGSVFGFGDAAYFGSLGGEPRVAAVVGMATTAAGRGYWLASADGDVAAFGDATTYGSVTSAHPPAPMVAIEATRSGRGYWLAGGDGSVFGFGDAGYFGSAHGGLAPGLSVTGMARTVAGDGYWLVSAQNSPVRIAATGDVHGNGRVRALLDGGGDPFQHVTSALSAADLAIVNLETPVGAPGVAQRKKYVFLAPMSLLRTARASGVDVVNLANNHALDHGPAALMRTIAHAREAGLAPVGAGASASEAYRAALFNVRGRSVAVLGLTRVMSAGWAATANGAGVASAYDQPAAVAAVRAAAASAEIVVVAIHWGIEMARCPDAHQRRLSRALRDAGADVIAGHHPHVLQGLDAAPAAVTAFSLGNFVWYHSAAPSSTTGILEVDVARGGGVTARLRPARINGSGQPVLLGGGDADRVRADVARLTPGAGEC